MYDTAVPTSLVILGCSQRKNQTSRMLPAIDRYDGPVFRVLRKHTREAAEDAANVCILSGRFGLIPGKHLVPRYDRQLPRDDEGTLRRRVERQVKKTLDEIQPERLFVSVGCGYWPLLEEPLSREIAASKLLVANGGIGGRASQLAHWLRLNDVAISDSALPSVQGRATLLGTSVRLSTEQVLRKAREAFLLDPVGAHRFETWHVDVGRERVAPKWLVSILFEKPVARFRTADARRTLSLLGVDCIYASRH